MSSKPTLVNSEISGYISEVFSSEDGFLVQLRKEAADNGIPDICISPEQGLFLQFLIKASGIVNILEIGSLAGYSAITMARALPKGGRLAAIEIELEYAHFIKRKAEQAGLSDVIEVINADARNYIDTIQGTMYDLIFLDADKRNYTEYFLKCERLLRTGGIFAADNAFAFGEITTEYPDRDNEEVEGIRNFNKYIRKRTDYTSCIVPVGDGMVLAVKL